MSIDDFLKKFKKGSKPFRRILDFERSQKIELKKNQRVKTFFRLSGLPIPEEKILEKLYAEWSMNCFPTRLRDFIFKFRNNLLGLNVRVAHFNNQVGRGCTFCSKVNPYRRQIPVPVPDETMEHLFHSCPYTKKVTKDFLRKYLPTFNTNDDQRLKMFIFTGAAPDISEDDNFFLRVISLHINYFIWQCKLQKQIPLLENCLNEVFYSVEIIRRINNKLREDMLLNLPLCRNWSEETSRRG
jgi:hypothetical protein